MSRVNDQVASRKRRKRILKDARGYRGGRSKLIRSAMEAVDKAGCYAYRDRRNKKRVIRALWIARINAAARMNGITYSRFMEGVIKSGVELNRTVKRGLSRELLYF